LDNEESICHPKNQIVIVKDLRTPTPPANNTQAATGSQVKQFLYNNLQQEASGAADSNINYVFMRLQSVKVFQDFSFAVKLAGSLALILGITVSAWAL
jgi:hypothetical protein